MNRKNNAKSSYKAGTLSFNGGIGSSSILVIFVILCLVSFATLSIVSANADYKLSTKILDRTTSYYEALNQAENNLSQLDKTLRDIYAETESAEDYFATVGNTKSFLIAVSDLQSLEITVEILYPDTPGDAFYQIVGRQVITVQELNYESTLNVIK